jgi:hypothetical protein
MVALPALWYGGLSMLLAVIALQREPWKSVGPGGTSSASSDGPAVTAPTVEPVTAVAS